MNYKILLFLSLFSSVGLANTLQPYPVIPPAYEQLSAATMIDKAKGIVTPVLVEQTVTMNNNNTLLLANTMIINPIYIDLSTEQSVYDVIPSY